MGDHYRDMQDSKKENKDRKNPQLIATLPMKCDHLAPDRYFDLEEVDQVDQGARDHEKEMIEEDKNQNRIQD